MGNGNGLHARSPDLCSFVVVVLARPTIIRQSAGGLTSIGVLPNFGRIAAPVAAMISSDSD